MGGILAGKLALITGGAGGIGFAAAKRFALEGARVALLDLDPQSTRDKARSLGDAAAGYGVDVRDHAMVNEVVDCAVDEMGGLDIVINAAGVLGSTASLWDTSADEWDRIFAVNARGTFSTIQAAVPHLRSRGSGSIINISSVAAKEARTAFVPYNASKAAVLNLTWSLALDLARENIRVNALCPGPVDTPMWAAKASELDGSAAVTARSEREAQTPMRRFATVDDVVQAMLFLVDDASDYFTGLSLDVAGGAHLGMGT